MRHLCVLLLIAACGCGGRKGPAVVLYTSVDSPFAEPMLRDFTAKTGIEVRPLFDTEAAKTVGLARRLLAESSSPRCDVFWSNEILQTVMLARAGLFAPYASPEAPPPVRGRGDLYTYFGGRLRVLLVRTDAKGPAAPPEGIAALGDKTHARCAAMAQPLAGTTLTHAVALFAAMGQERAVAFFEAILGNGTKIVPGNATAKDLVVEGEAAFCLTDSDDAEKGRAESPAVRVVVPDQTAGGMGALMIPGSIALLARAPHPEEAKKLIDFLLSKEVSARMRREGAFQLPLRDDGGPTPEMYRPERVRIMAVDWEKVHELLPAAQELLMRLFLR